MSFTLILELSLIAIESNICLSACSYRAYMSWKQTCVINTFLASICLKAFRLFWTASPEAPPLKLPKEGSTRVMSGLRDGKWRASILILHTIKIDINKGVKLALGQGRSVHGQVQIDISVNNIVFALNQEPEIGSSPDF